MSEQGVKGRREGDGRPPRVTVPGLRQRKQRGQKIVMVTAYDTPSALLAERAGVDSILVGDSVGTTMLGYDTTVPVTLEEILHHLRAVRRGVQRTLLIADLPFGTYQDGPSQALHSAFRLMKEGGAHAVKVEGGAARVETVSKLTAAGIPVMGHLGLTPQSVYLFGGHRTQGKSAEDAQQMLEDAQALEAAGAFGVVLETIPAALAAQISQALAIPTIGIGAGLDCDGQVQVWHDLLGLYPEQMFHHAKRYAEIGVLIENALREYSEEVRQSRFPTKEHSL
ncbi:MAG TPA: 3-methyl-2-oxobutanoate hydroxymethyltransferase [Chthonomonadaceae bacterium]|nr:3-methyl-2-oxobutanoate hydroxymethyltransferase [Chthonomonadaceae bacterium]